MMRKLFTFLFAALMSVSMWADPTVVTWYPDDVFGSGSGNSFSKDGVTLNCHGIDNGTISGSGTFTTTLGNFTKIEITTEWIDPLAGWEEGSVCVGWDDEKEEWKYIPKWTWTGDAASVSFGSGQFGGLWSIEFTIGPGSAPEPEPEPAVPEWVRDGDEWDDATKTLTVKSNLPEDAYKDQTVIQHVIISSGVTSIGVSAFDGCTGLKSVTIPSSVTSIGGSAFAACSALTSVTNYALTPQAINSNVFDEVDLSSCTLNVPKGSIDLYQAAEVWQDFIFPPTWVRDGDEWNAATKTLTVNSNPTWRVYRWHDYEIEKVIINSGVTTIYQDAFYRDISVTDVYCYPNAGILDWYEDSCDDFKADGSTLCHVHADQLEAYISKFTGVVNVTFVGDLPGKSPAPTPTDEQVTTNEDPENPGVYYYSTFYHSTQKYALTNDGTVAFVADLSGSDLLLTKIAEGTDVIPANTAVIFRKAGSADPVVLNPTDAEAVSFTANNDLEGVDAETAVTSIAGLTTTNCYVLSGTNENGVGFYRINSDNLKAHKAYVKYVSTPGQGNAPKKMRFVFEQENTATGVENANLKPEIKNQKFIKDGQLIIIKNGVRYNAQGQVIK